MKKLVSYKNPEINKYEKYPLQEFSIQFEGKIPSSKDIKLIINTVRIVSKLNKQIILRIGFYSTDDSKYDLKWLAYPYRSKAEQEKVKYPETISGIQLPEFTKPTFLKAKFQKTVIPVTMLPLLLNAPKILLAITTVLLGLGWVVSALKSQKTQIAPILALPQIVLLFGTFAVTLFIIREFKKKT